MNDFAFYPYHDSYGNDMCFLPGLSIEELMRKCIEDPNCRGFNTLGWMKHSIYEDTELGTLNTGGLYVYIPRDVDRISKFNFYPMLDIPGYDIRYIGNKSIYELKSICLSTPGCVGFNSSGWLKHTFDYNKLVTVNCYRGLYTDGFYELKPEYIKSTIDRYRVNALES